MNLTSLLRNLTFKQLTFLLNIGNIKRYKMVSEIYIFGKFGSSGRFTTEAIVKKYRG